MGTPPKTRMKRHITVGAAPQEHCNAVKGVKATEYKDKNRLALGGTYDGDGQCRARCRRQPSTNGCHDSVALISHSGLRRPSTRYAWKLKVVVRSAGGTKTGIPPPLPSPCVGKTSITDWRIRRYTVVHGAQLIAGHCGSQTLCGREHEGGGREHEGGGRKTVVVASAPTRKRHDGPPRLCSATT